MHEEKYTFQAENLTFPLAFSSWTASSGQITEEGFLNVKSPQSCHLKSSNSILFKEPIKMSSEDHNFIITR